MISFMRGSGVVAIWLTTASVMDSGVYGCMGVLPGPPAVCGASSVSTLPAIVRVRPAIFNSEVKMRAYGHIVFC